MLATDVVGDEAVLAERGEVDGDVEARRNREGSPTDRRAPFKRRFSYVCFV